MKSSQVLRTVITKGDSASIDGVLGIEWASNTVTRLVTDRDS